MIKVMTTAKHYLARIEKGKDFQLELAAVKAIPGRRFSTNNNWWEIPIDRFASQDEFEQQLKFNVNVECEKRDAEKSHDISELTLPIPTKRELFPFQRDGVAYLVGKGSAILADQQGLGKTAQAIAAVATLGAFPCLIIAKKSLLHNWRNEVEDWIDKRAIVFNDSIKNSWHAFFQTGAAHVGIVNYDSVKKYFVSGFDMQPGTPGFMVKHIRYKATTEIFKSIIIDESHLIKDGNSIRTKLIIGLCFKRPHVYCLSGTPMLNDAKEFYPQLAALNKAYLFGKKEQFYGAYSGQKNRGNLRTLNGILKKHCFIRRTKAEVLKDLPDKTRQVIRCELTNRADYDAAEKDFQQFAKQAAAGPMDKAVRQNALVKINKLKKLSAIGKMEAVTDWAEEMAYNKEKVVMFGFHIDITEQLAKILPGSVRLCASADMETQQQRKHAFQTDPNVPAIVCSLSADAEGHTLTAASNLAMVEFPWTFGKAEQCEDRIHRIGQKNAAVIAYFVAENTIDQHIYNIIMDKKSMHDDVTGTDDVEAPVSYIDKLINLFNRKN